MERLTREAIPDVIVSVVPAEGHPLDAPRAPAESAGQADYKDVAVLIPCYNEAHSIAAVVRDFQRVLPGSRIYVYDNNSTDETAARAKAAGATVGFEELQGKGHVIRRMFADIEADVYLMVDGDGTYDPESACRLIRTLEERDLDVVNARRVHESALAYRPGHQFGNVMLTRMVGNIFGQRIRDMLSGYKAFSRRFVKSFPCLSTGFEIETEVAIHALALKMPLGEVDVPYRERDVSSPSKLNTVRDGIRILLTVMRLLSAERPLLFFGVVSALLAIPAMVLGVELYFQFEATHLVLHFPTAILATGMMIMAALSLVCGIVLETVTLGRREQKRMIYLSIRRRL